MMAYPTLSPTRLNHLATPASAPIVHDVPFLVLFLYLYWALPSTALCMISFVRSASIEFDTDTDTLRVLWAFLSSRAGLGFRSEKGNSDSDARESKESKPCAVLVDFDRLCDSIGKNRVCFYACPINRDIGQ